VVFLFQPHLAEGAGTTREAQILFFIFSYYLAEGAGTTREANNFFLLLLTLRRGRKARSAEQIFLPLFL
jgi:hypothetical protein